MNGETVKIVTTKPKAVNGSLGLKTQSPGQALTVSVVAEVSRNLIVLE